MTDAKTLCVAGVSGLVGSQITKAALERGYRVYGTMRDAGDSNKRPHLMALPGAGELVKPLIFYYGAVAFAWGHALPRREQV